MDFINYVKSEKVWKDELLKKEEPVLPETPPVEVKKEEVPVEKKE